MRRTALAAIFGMALLMPAIAHAATVTASSGDVSATLSYADGPGITTRNERLKITENDNVVYDRAVPATGCFKVCSPEGRDPLAITDLYGDDGDDVVLAAFTGGADCCTLADVFVPSAAMRTYVLDQHNFGEAGFVLRRIGPGGRPLFVSGDQSFYCRFTDCAGSALPLQILEFDEERFKDVTRQYPRLIAGDAAKWLKLYYNDPGQGLGAIAAWAADDDQLGKARQATVRTVLQLQVADGRLKRSFVSQLQTFLATHGYR